MCGIVVYVEIIGHAKRWPILVEFVYIIDIDLSASMLIIFVYW